MVVSASNIFCYLLLTRSSGLKELMRPEFFEAAKAEADVLLPYVTVLDFGQGRLLWIKTS